MSFDKWKEYPCCNVQQDNFCFLLEVIQHGIPAVLGVKIIGFQEPLACCGCLLLFCEFLHTFIFAYIHLLCLIVF